MPVMNSENDGSISIMSSENDRAMQNQIDSSEHVKSHYYTSGDGCYVRLSPTAWKILSGRESGRSFEELAKELSNEGEEHLTSDDVEKAWQYLHLKVEEIQEKSSPVRSGFWLRLPLLSRSLVIRISSLLRTAYHPAIAVALLSLTAIGAVLFSVNYHRTTTPLRLEHIVFGYGLYLFSTLMHELGHSTACKRFGAQPSAIGFTLYMVYPALYSDVSDAWRLRRWQRVVVDLGGMYFQLVVAAAYAIAWQFTGWWPFKMAIFGVIASGIINLNPILRFDGYWVISDVLGVTNLARQPLMLAKTLILRLRGKPYPASRWPFKITLLLSFYSIAWFGFVIWFAWRLFPLVWSSFGNYPELLRGGLNTLHGDSARFNPRPLFSLLLSTAVIFAIFRLLWVLRLRSVFRRLTSRVASTKEVTK